MGHPLLAPFEESLNSVNQDDHSHNEIIIVRRGNHDDHDEHHGGVWKIAFADFMTAMMAFFLVMWLINASNEETKKAVASYFNPIKLMDRTSNPKGVRSPKYAPSTENDKKLEDQSTVITSSKGSPAKVGGVAETFDEKALFTDPYALLADISAGIDLPKKERDDATSGNPQQNVGLGLSGGIAFQDPFDPSAWNLKFSPKQDKPKVVKMADEIEPEMNKPAELLDNDPSAKQPPEGIEKIAAKEKIEDVEEKKNAENKKIVDQVRKATQKLLSTSGAEAPSINIQQQGKGLLVILSESSKAGMFNVGSARPTAELVRIMAGIGKLLSKQQGQVTIAGHTDGRKFKSGDYDNWRLSTARAHMAHYMLVNGGLPEERIERIEGYAAVKLINPDKPFSAENRRIELFLNLR